MIQKLKIEKKVYLQAFFMLLSVFLFSLNDSLNKIFVSSIRSQEIIFWRSVFETISLSIFLLFIDRNKPYAEKLSGIIKTPYLKMHILRVAIGLSAILIEIYSLKFLPLGSFAFIAAFNPILIILFSFFFLKERPHRKIWFMVICGALSAVIMSCSNEGMNFFGAEYAILSIILYSLNVVLTKKCTEDGPFRILFFYAFLSIIPCFLACNFTFDAQKINILYFFGQSFLHMAAFFTFVKALSLGDLSRAIPLEYSDILWATLLGYLFFGEAPEILFWSAAFILIIGKTIYFWRGKSHE